MLLIFLSCFNFILFTLLGLLSFGPLSVFLIPILICKTSLPMQPPIFKFAFITAAVDVRQHPLSIFSVILVLPFIFSAPFMVWGKCKNSFSVHFVVFPIALVNTAIGSFVGT